MIVNIEQLGSYASLDPVLPPGRPVALVAAAVARDGPARIRQGVDAAAAARGGWDIDRHGRYPTTDMPIAEAGPALEALIRQRVFSRVLQPLELAAAR